MTIAYVYKWTHLPTMKYYIGSRSSKGCHPNDGYLCSSRIVKPMIEKNPQDWERTIIAIGSPDDMWNLETEILQTFDCANDPRSFNKHNNNFKFRYDKTGMKESPSAIKNKADAHRGKKRPRQAELLRGRKRPEFAEKMKGKLVGEKNPSSKTYVVTDPHGNQFEITSLKAFAESISKPLITAREMASKYPDNTAQSGSWMGWSIKFK